jgi:hypothetical protein
MRAPGDAAPSGRRVPLPGLRPGGPSRLATTTPQKSATVAAVINRIGPPHTAASGIGISLVTELGWRVSVAAYWFDEPTSVVGSLRNRAHTPASGASLKGLWSVYFVCHGYVPLATSLASRTSDASRSDNCLGVAEIPKQLSPAPNHHVCSSVANCTNCRSAVDDDQSSVDACKRVAAILLRVRPLSKKSPRLYVPVGDEGFPTTRVHCHTQEPVSARKQCVRSRSWKGL